LSFRPRKNALRDAGVEWNRSAVAANGLISSNRPIRLGETWDMTAVDSKPAATATRGNRPPFSVNDLVLLRIAAGGATRADLQRDLATLVVPRTPGTQFRRAAELAIGAHMARHLATETRGRISPSAAGRRAAAELLEPLQCDLATWQAAKVALTLRALKLDAATTSIAKGLNRPEGISALVLQNHFSLGKARVLSPATLRAELAVIALERAFGNRIKTGLGKGQGLPAKAGRILAGQLLKQPREIGTDGKLVVALAAEILATKDTSADGLTLALLRNLTTARDTSDDTFTDRANLLERKAKRPAPKPDNDAAPLARQLPSGRPAPVRPDMLEFASAVVAAARPVAQGWSGNRKAFISLVWNAIRNTRPEWELTEIAFKSMLAEAHRTGNVVLAGADLKDKCDLKELEDSKILYKNTVWHFVRVED
jgi:hypothetical protein